MNKCRFMGSSPDTMNEELLDGAPNLLTLCWLKSDHPCFKYRGNSKWFRMFPKEPLVVSSWDLLRNMSSVYFVHISPFIMFYFLTEFHTNFHLVMYFSVHHYVGHKYYSQTGWSLSNCRLFKGKECREVPITVCAWVYTKRLGDEWLKWLCSFIPFLHFLLLLLFYWSFLLATFLFNKSVLNNLCFKKKRVKVVFHEMQSQFINEPRLVKSRFSNLR